MVKQYVGARYVPKFASPVEWAANTSYEALTIVTFNNASYTSKIQVPPTVGNPANNPQYWVLTGNYNAQVEQYRQETENYNAQVEEYRQTTVDLQNKINTRILFIGDSYGVGTDGNAGWCQTVKNMMPNYDIQHIEAGGLGFVGIDGTFLNFLTTSLHNIRMPNTITDIYVMGGWNDINGTKTAIVSAITSFLNYCKTKFPIAKVHIGFISASGKRQSGTSNLMSIVLPAYIDGSSTVDNGDYIHNSEIILHGNNKMSAEGTHPSSTGYAVLAKQIYSIVKTGNVNIHERFSANLIKDKNNGIDLTLEAKIDNDITTLSVDILTQGDVHTNIDVNSPLQPFKLGTINGINGYHIDGAPLPTIYLPCTISVLEPDAAYYKDLSAAIAIEYGNVYLYVNNIDALAFAPMRLNGFNFNYGTTHIPTIGL